MPEALSPKVAVIGGGQLARMMAEPAAAMGIHLRLLAEAEGVSAAQVIVDQQVGAHTDLATLAEVTEGCAVVTFDHEHVPTEHLRELERSLAVRPGPDALVHAQDKGVMRERLGAMGIPCPRNALVSTPEDVVGFGFPAVLKTPRGGYDGKGVWVVTSPDEAAEVLGRFEAADLPLLVEEKVDFVRELSALVARSPSDQFAVWPVVQSTQLDGICHEVIAPAPGLNPAQAYQAQQMAMRIARELGVTGVLAVELFETRDGAILVNELAMRPHNTGHWTQDGAVTSQFENHLRAVLDLPLGAPDPRARWSVMVNILGGPSSSESSGPATAPLYDGYPHALARDPRLRVHLYGKAMRPGRKVGHVNAYGDELDEVLERARHAAAWFRGDLGEESE